MNRNLTYAIVPLRISGAVAAGTGDTITFTEVDTKGFNSVLFLVTLGAVTATGTARLNAKASDTTGTYGAGTIDTLATAAQEALATTGDSNKIMSLEVYKPRRRFLRAQLVRATANVAVESVLAILYNAQDEPTTLAAANQVQPASVLNNPAPSAT